MNRQASEERRELISHTTRVENIISLLSAKYVGTPHLSFSVSPQPLQQLSVDPSDPNLWFRCEGPHLRASAVRRPRGHLHACAAARKGLSMAAHTLFGRLASRTWT
jgi:hypothetical protein